MPSRPTVEQFPALAGKTLSNAELRRATPRRWQSILAIRRASSKAGLIRAVSNEKNPPPAVHLSRATPSADPVLHHTRLAALASPFRRRASPPSATAGNALNTRAEPRCDAWLAPVPVLATFEHSSGTRRPSVTLRRVRSMSGSFVLKSDPNVSVLMDSKSGNLEFLFLFGCLDS
ncbi:integrator complex subunit 3 homolog [Striga asiatica]|uniref:Integrator complex subunit 3 homolog n=1 Tax=Striga asiatica TaxID=4170 RepID=A0A5A7P3Q2_STRAF|nr:integrator complex subunit 3 homolog [Striga asiatica]